MIQSKLKEYLEDLKSEIEDINTQFRINIHSSNSEYLYRNCSFLINDPSLNLPRKTIPKEIIELIFSRIDSILDMDKVHFLRGSINGGTIIEMYGVGDNNYEEWIKFKEKVNRSYDHNYDHNYELIYTLGIIILTTQKIQKFESFK